MKCKIDICCGLSIYCRIAFATLRAILAFMNVDLFFRNGGGLCFLFDAAPEFPLQALVYDDRAQQFYLEFGPKASSFLLNIAVHGDAADYMHEFSRAHVGLIDKGTIKEALNMPVLHMAAELSAMNETNYGGGRDVTGLHDILNNCHFAQAVHREDIGNEEQANSILGEVPPHLIAFSPAMAQALKAERVQRPSFEPSAPHLQM